MGCAVNREHTLRDCTRGAGGNPARLSHTLEITVQRYSHALLVLAFALLSSSCAGTTSERVQQTPTNRDIITQEQLHQFTNAYEAIQALRPTWLRPRGVNSIRSPSQVWVYRDGTRLGGVETLRGASILDIAEIRFYDAAAANQRWGVGHGAGVISVATRSR